MRGLASTVAAVATPPGEGGLAVVRISGAEAIPIADRVFVAHRAGVTLAATTGHRARYGKIVDPVTGLVLDEGLALVMRGPHSFTGEDTVEFSCHGGTFVVRRVLGAVLREGARLAEPGEFTRRAFLNGRLDLVQVEGVIDLIKAGGEAARQAALQLLDGDLSRRLGGLRQELLALLAYLEAAVDFPEEDISFLSGEEIAERLAGVVGELERLAGSFDRGRVAREGIAVAIAGRPNVGKSSILNGLLREERAIVTSVAGTTRDTIEESISVDGVLVRLVDTAGIRETSDPVERIGVERAGRAVETADWVLLVVDASESLTPEDLAAGKAAIGKPTVVALNKCDLGVVTDEAAIAELVPGAETVRTSAPIAGGLAPLEAVLSRIVGESGKAAPGAEVPAITRLRHREALELALDALRHAVESNADGMSEDLVALDVRGALDGLDELLGVDAPDELLDKIFREFCIGK